jgi:hypothetical protein
LEKGSSNLGDGQSNSPPISVSDYELKIDAQVEQFLETKHKLVYFIVTASVAPIIVTVQFVYGKPLATWIGIVASVGVIAGLATAGSALTALWFEVASYRNHIQYRYEKKNWADLNEAQQRAWTKINRMAAKFTKISFLVIFFEFALFAVVGVGLILSPPERPHGGISIQLPFRWGERMHHFGEDFTTGRIETGRFVIEARHHSTNAVVEMSGPTVGVFSDPTKVVDQQFVDGLALEFAHFLRAHLDSSPAAAVAK